jgi:AraC-like DNA-binding protein
LPDPAGATVSLTALTPFVRLLEEQGPDLVTRITELSQACFTRWGIALAELDATVRLPHGLVIELLELFVDVLGDPSAPVRAGTKLRLGDYELLEYLCCSAPTLGETIACLGRYYPLLIAAECELWTEGERAETRFRIAPGLPAPDAINEFALASNLMMTALHIELDPQTPPPLPIEITFAHRAPSYAELLPQLFLAPVRFEQEHNAIVFPASVLAHPMRTRDPILHAMLMRQADQELAALSDKSAFPAKVIEAIEALLPEGAPLEAVADRLHVSPSALRTRLQKHGTNYSALLDRLRRDHARRALRQSRLSIAEVGQQLGFAHPPAFHRAFRRWFGVAPSEFREAPIEHPASRFFRTLR